MGRLRDKHPEVDEVEMRNFFLLTPLYETKESTNERGERGRQNGRRGVEENY